jgi:hypothetical protein
MEDDDEMDMKGSGMGPEGGKTNNDMEEGISMDEELGKKDKN